MQVIGMAQCVKYSLNNWNSISNNNYFCNVLDVNSLAYLISNGKEFSFSRGDIYGMINGFGN